MTKEELIQALGALRAGLATNEIATPDKIAADTAKRDFYQSEVEKYNSLIESKNSAIETLRNVVDTAEESKASLNEMISEWNTIKEEELIKNTSADTTETELAAISKNVANLNVAISTAQDEITKIDNAPALLAAEERELASYQEELATANARLAAYNNVVENGFTSADLTEDINAMIEALNNGEITVEDATAKLESYLDVNLANVDDQERYNAMNNAEDAMVSLENEISTLEAKLANEENYRISFYEELQLKEDITASKKSKRDLSLALAAVTAEIAKLTAAQKNGIDSTNDLANATATKENIESQIASLNNLISTKQARLDNGYNMIAKFDDMLALDNAKKNLIDLKEKHNNLEFDVRAMISSIISEPVKAAETVVTGFGEGAEAETIELGENPDMVPVTIDIDAPDFEPLPEDFGKDEDEEILDATELGNIDAPDFEPLPEKTAPAKEDLDFAGVESKDEFKDAMNAGKLFYHPEHGVSKAVSGPGLISKKVKMTDENGEEYECPFDELSVSTKTKEDDKKEVKAVTVAAYEPATEEQIKQSKGKLAQLKEKLKKNAKHILVALAAGVATIALIMGLKGKGEETPAPAPEVTTEAAIEDETPVETAQEEVVVEEKEEEIKEEVKEVAPLTDEEIEQIAKDVIAGVYGKDFNDITPETGVRWKGLYDLLLKKGYTDDAEIRAYIDRIQDAINRLMPKHRVTAKPAAPAAQVETPAAELPEGLSIIGDAIFDEKGLNVVPAADYDAIEAQYGGLKKGEITVEIANTGNESKEAVEETNRKIENHEYKVGETTATGQKVISIETKTEGGQQTGESSEVVSNEVVKPNEGETVTTDNGLNVININNGGNQTNNIIGGDNDGVITNTINDSNGSEEIGDIAEPATIHYGDIRWNDEDLKGPALKDGEEIVESNIVLPDIEWEDMELVGPSGVIEAKPTEETISIDEKGSTVNFDEAGNVKVEIVDSSENQEVLPEGYTVEYTGGDLQFEDIDGKISYPGEETVTEEKVSTDSSDFYSSVLNEEVNALIESWEEENSKTR